MEAARRSLGANRSPSLFDLGLAALFVAGTAAVGIAWSRRGLLGWALAASAGMAVLGLRRSRPLVATFGIAATVPGVAAVISSPGAPPPLFGAIMVAAYSLGAYASFGDAAVGLPALVAAVGLAQAQSRSHHAGDSAASALAFFGTVAVLVPYATGRVVRSRRLLARRLEQTAEQLRSGAAEGAAAAVAQERANLGQTLERTALGGLDAMAPYSQVGSLADVEAIEGIARRTLTGVRGLLVGLRGEPEPPAPARPLNELRAQVEAALAAAPISPPEAAKVSGRWSLIADHWFDRVLVAVGIALGAALVVSTAAHRRPTPMALGVALSVVMGLAVIGLRRWPMPAALLSCVAAVCYSAAVQPRHPEGGWDPTAVLALAPFALGMWERQRLRAIIGLGACLVAAPALVWVDPAHVLERQEWPVTSLGLIVGLFVIGIVIQFRSHTLADVARAALRLGEDRARQSRNAIAEERSRVARELHDALAHSLTAILLQATAARRVWETNPELARQHTTSLRDTLAEAGGELRELIVALTMGAEANVSLDRLEVLVERGRACGIDVDLCIDIDGLPPERDRGVDSATYRIVQEALTNAARHAPGSHVDITVTYRDQRVSVTVANGSPATPPFPIRSARHGIEGMRERASTCGGRLQAGALPSGGFLVTAELPAGVII